MADQELRDAIAEMPFPELGPAAFNRPPSLSEAVVAIVTTAGLMRPGEKSWEGGDSSFRVFDRVERDLIVGHVSLNFDRTGVSADRNVVYPIDRLEEMASEGVIGSVSRRHMSFMGALGDLSTVFTDSGPAAAKMLKDDGVDVVVLTPV